MHSIFMVTFCWPHGLVVHVQFWSSLAPWGPTGRTLFKKKISWAKIKNMFVSGRLMIGNRVGRSAFNFFFFFFFLTKYYNAVKCKIKCYINDFNKILLRISLNKARNWIMVLNCNIKEFRSLTSIIYLHNENMDFELTIKKLGLVYEFRFGRANGNEHIFYVGISMCLRGLTVVLFCRIHDLDVQCASLVQSNCPGGPEGGKV